MRSSSTRRAQISRADCTFDRVFSHRRFSAPPGPLPAPLSEPPLLPPLPTWFRRRHPHLLSRLPPGPASASAFPVPAPSSRFSHSPASTCSRPRFPCFHPRLSPGSGFGSAFPSPALTFRIPGSGPASPPTSAPPARHLPSLPPPALPIPASARIPHPAADLRGGAALQQGVLHISHRKDGPARGRPWFPSLAV